MACYMVTFTFKNVFSKELESFKQRIIKFLLNEMAVLFVKSEKKKEWKPKTRKKKVRKLAEKRQQKNTKQNK
jgi:hypothetical protein